MYSVSWENEAREIVSLEACELAEILILLQYGNCTEQFQNISTQHWKTSEIVHNC